MWVSIFSYQYFLEESFNKSLVLQEGVQELQNRVQTREFLFKGTPPSCVE